MDEKTILIPLEYELLLSCLFGKSNYHATTGDNNIKFLKSTFIKIIKGINRSINLNIYTCDKILKDKLIKLCNSAIHDIESTDSSELLTIKMITNLTKIVFNLLGQNPNNWDKRKTNFNKEWKLDKYRNIIYTNNYRQQTFLILDNYGTFAEINSSLNIDELKDKLNYEFHNDYYKFVNWFKDNYYEIYKEIV